MKVEEKDIAKFKLWCKNEGYEVGEPKGYHDAFRVHDSKKGWISFQTDSSHCLCLNGRALRLFRLYLTKCK